LWYGFSLGNFHTVAWGALDNLYLAYVIAILIGISWVISPTEKLRLPMTPLVVLTLLFSLWMTITSVFALGPSEIVWERWVVVHKILLMCLVGYALTTTRERVDQLIWVVVLAVGFWGVKGAVSSILHGGATTGIHGPEAGVAADNNSFGIALIMILPLVFYHWHIAVNRHIRHGLMIMGFLVSLAVIFTYSRGALLGVCARGQCFGSDHAPNSRPEFSFSSSDCSFTVSCPNTGSTGWQLSKLTSSIPLPCHASISGKSLCELPNCIPSWAVDSG
jgi:putative inorganic carbon (HCO3(-)) transporter